MKYCPNCGGVVQDGMNVCPNCGTPLNVQPTVNPQPVQAQAPNPGPGFNAAARPVVENRNIATCIILSFVTCGIYGLIWFFNMVTDVNRVCNDEKSSQTAGTVFLLTIVTCGIYGIIWYYQAGARLAKAGQKYGIQIADNSTLYLILNIFGLGIVTTCLIQTDLNKFSPQG